MGPFFSRSTPAYFQIDLIFCWADKVLTVVEIKYFQAPTTKTVIQEFDRKMALFVVPPRHSVERVLVTASECDLRVIDAGYFDDILTLQDLMCGR